VVRSSHAALLERARASFAQVGREPLKRRTRLDVRCFGSAGSPLKAIVSTADSEVVVRSEVALAPATSRALDVAQLREQFGRLGETPFALGDLDAAGLGSGLFLPVSEVNRLRQAAVDELMVQRDWARESELETRRMLVEEVVRAVLTAPTRADEPRTAPLASPSPARLIAEVWRIEDADAALAAGADEIVFDPFLRHPFPTVSAVSALVERIAAAGKRFRLRLPTIVRPADRKKLDKWLALGTPILSGHVGLAHELGSAGRDVVADYAANCFNAHTASELFDLGASRITPSIELTTEEIGELVAPWQGDRFDVVVFGRPEGMTLEHCVLSAAFDRTPTHCRDLCTKQHMDTRLTDPAGYVFPVATDYACRNRLLHSRPIDGTEFLPRLWEQGIRGFRLLFNLPTDDVGAIVAGYRAELDAIAAGGRPQRRVRVLLGEGFTRGHFARAV
jgi:putative protease